MSALLNFIWISIPFLVALVSFTTYIFMDGGNILTADKVRHSSFFLQYGKILHFCFFRLS